MISVENNYCYIRRHQIIAFEGSIVIVIYFVPVTPRNLWQELYDLTSLGNIGLSHELLLVFFPDKETLLFIFVPFNTPWFIFVDVLYKNHLGLEKVV